MSLERKKGLARSSLRPKRATPRRREAPRWTAAEWMDANALLLSRAGGRCECCGEPLLAVERHHRMRRRDGGDRLSNLLALLPACHAYWTQHPEEAHGRGIILWTSDSPADPVLWRGVAWRVLTDGGGTCHPDEQA